MDPAITPRPRFCTHERFEKTPRGTVCAGCGEPVPLGFVKPTAADVTKLFADACDAAGIPATDPARSRVAKHMDANAAEIERRLAVDPGYEPPGADTWPAFVPPHELPRPFAESLMPGPAPHVSVGYETPKPRIDLIPARSLLAVAEVLTWGLPSEGNPPRWTQRTPAKHVSSALRHIVAWLDGERLDPESKLPHLAHAAARLLFALAREIRP